MLEVVKLAYRDRDCWIGDPACGPSHDGDARQGLRGRAPAQFDPRKPGDLRAGSSEGDPGFVVADGHGNVLSVIQSLFNAFGPAWSRGTGSVCRIAGGTSLNPRIRARGAGSVRSTR
jgi:gamma-glutamyltranspeptidase